MIEFKHEQKPMKLSRAISLIHSEVSYNTVMKLLRKKDIRVNGIKISSDVDIDFGDIVTLYVPQYIANLKKDISNIIYSDNNILVVDKPRGIEVEGENSLTEFYTKTGYNVIAVHRLDRNTSGLVIFALNSNAESELLNAFKDRRVDKVYRAELAGHLQPKSNILTAYLFKDSQASRVNISFEKKENYVLIKTGYQVIEEKEYSSIVDINLFTGRTHQIRAHMGAIGHGVIGDGKYGDYELNKKLKPDSQRLKAYKLTFKFSDGILKYLDGKTFETDCDIN